ncbi:hypothetical protein Tco_0939681 [Tanacetum coccineum]|uniref:Uncharacterized protein n=1 Tax=Tanacetum coccineum TaxID=301880 RepID=A0ABQ5DKR9_9ASTR
MKEQEVHAIKEIEKLLNESKMQSQEGMVNEGIALDAGLDSKESTYDNTSTEQIQNHEKLEVEIYTKVNHEAQQANAFLTKELEIYKEKEKYFAKETTNESEYYKKIKLLNDEISNLKSQACQKEKTFARENGKYDNGNATSLSALESSSSSESLATFRAEIAVKRTKLRFMLAYEVSRAVITTTFLPRIILWSMRTGSERRVTSSSSNLHRTGHSMLNFEKQTIAKQEINRDEIFTSWIHENDVMRKVHKRLSKEFKLLTRDINLQLKYFEHSLVKEMNDDLKYVMSLEDEFDDRCLILDIQTKFFKTQFESAISESYNHVYENEMYEQKATWWIFKRKSNKDKVKHDIDVIESINIDLENKVAKLLKENEHLKAQIQEKVFATATLKKKLRKATCNSVDTKFAEPSILGKPHLQPLRN